MFVSLCLPSPSPASLMFCATVMPHPSPPFFCLESLFDFLYPPYLIFFLPSFFFLLLFLSELVCARFCALLLRAAMPVTFYHRSLQKEGAVSPVRLPASSSSSPSSLSLDWNGLFLLCVAGLSGCRCSSCLFLLFLCCRVEKKIASLWLQCQV